MVVQWCIFIASLLVIHTEEKERAARAKKLPTTNPSFVPTNAAALSSFPPSTTSSRMYHHIASYHDWLLVCTVTLIIIMIIGKSNGGIGHYNNIHSSSVSVPLGNGSDHDNDIMDAFASSQQVDGNINNISATATPTTNYSSFNGNNSNGHTTHSSSSSSSSMSVSSAMWNGASNLIRRSRAAAANSVQKARRSRRSVA
jgi:hypothetical protein